MEILFLADLTDCEKEWSAGCKSWRSFRQQIPSGLNYMATGNPYWTVDVGSFFTARDGRWFRCGDFPAGVDDDGYKEYYVRMFQWATFLPVLRSHGSDTPREIWRFGEPGSKYYDAILGMIELRYRLIPYIYSLAFRQTLGGYSIARHLAFDFADDVNVRDIKDEYMFGDILVCPVTYPGAVSRKVYLPALDGGRKWIDYFTGESHDGGRWIDCDSPLGRIPLFVRGGSIIAGGDAVEYADAQIGGDITVNVYPGADAEFMFYEDEGDNYNFEKGSRMTVAMAWNDGERTLKVGSRCGEYPGMPSVRTLRIVSPYGEKTVDYDGTELTIRL